MRNMFYLSYREYKSKSFSHERERPTETEITKVLLFSAWTEL